MSPLSPLRQTVLDALMSTGIDVAVLGLDISLNEHLTGDFDSHWLVHPRVHVPWRLSQSDVADLRQHFPTDDLIRKPLKVARFDGDLTGIAYSMKPRFERRQSYRQIKPTDGGSRECQNTRGRPLRGSEAVELAVFLDRLGLRKRLILLGASLALRTDGTVRIERKQPPRSPQWQI